MFFIVDDKNNGILELKAHLDLPAPFHTLCSQVSLGNCLCGRAALSQEIIFVDHVDTLQDSTFEDMHEHGHYYVPITSAEQQRVSEKAPFSDGN